MASDEPALIDVLLGTYNGAEFVAEQIESVFRQTYPNLRILARDDGSNDGTVEILEGYAERFPDRFQLIADRKGNLGFRGNFSLLMETSTSDYVAFCDQDDVWLPGKLTLGMALLKTLESKHGKAMPLLVHGDMRVVDRDLGEISPSFWHYQGLDPSTDDQLNRLLIQNVITGCASLMNRSLRDISTPIPPQAKAHDWWIALVAAAFGAVGHVDEPSMLYRQHGGNSIGAKEHGRERFSARALRFFRELSKSRAELRKTFSQAEAFAGRHGDSLPPQQAALLRDFLAIPRSGSFTRLRYARKWRILPPTVGFSVAFTIASHGLVPEAFMATEPDQISV